MSDVRQVKADVLAATATVRGMPIAETTEKVRRLDSARVAELIGEAVALLTGMKPELDEAGEVAAATNESGDPVYETLRAVATGSTNLNLRGAVNHANGMLDRLVDQSEGIASMGEDLEGTLAALADAQNALAEYERIRTVVTQSGEEAAAHQEQYIEAATRYTDHLG
ncbi:MAG TPA: hypothetical protein VLH86_05305 [Patescibacteria group bacterium]|nr:hypothetical protein [Patescibacteria group bacterium]